MTTTPKPQNTTTVPQALLKRNPTMSTEEFSTHWFKNHAAIVLPYFLANGVDYYAQIHNPTLTSPITAPKDLDISEWDGAAELRFRDVRPEQTAAGKKYFEEVILMDERRFLVGEALGHVRMVGAGVVTGERRVIIEDGKVVCGLDWVENGKIWEGYVGGESG